jgi:MurNAc alpha-1-phosphate uridylyltransferase
MKAMILAAGEGRRMQPLTLNTPKPLLKVRGRALIEHHLDRLAAAGIGEVIINVAYLGQQIRDTLGDGGRWGVSIRYSEEPEPLETAGALYHAKVPLGNEPFLLINGDVWTDYPFEQLMHHSLTGLGRLVMVANPEFKAHGDFSLDAQGYVLPLVDPGWTFSGISILSPELIHSYPHPATRLALLPVFLWAIKNRMLTGEVYSGAWSDVGTPERLESLNTGWLE